MTYRSKVDAWIAVGAVGAAAVLVGWGLVPLLRRHAWGHAAVVIGMMALVAVLTYPLHYRVTDRELVVRSGIQRWRIPLANILGVQPRLNFIASPALSLDRLEVQYEENGREQSILISPQREDEFLLDLATRVRRLRPWGFGLARLTRASRTAQPALRMGAERNGALLRYPAHPMGRPQ